MASPSAGIYRIVSAKGSSSDPYCLDVRGGSNKNGANVQIHTPNYTQAQFFKLSYRSDGSAQLLSMWSGKSMDIASGNVASGTNIQQYTDNDTRAQKWTIESDGDTATYDGEELATYTIASFVASTLVFDIAGGDMENGTNVRVYTANSTEAQQWLFVPMPEFASGGIYELRSMLKTSMAVDISGASRVRGGNAQLWNANGTNAQKFLITEESDDEWSIYNINSEMYLDVAGDATTSGTNVQQWTDDDSRAQRWYLTQYGTTTIKGKECIVVTIGSWVAGSGLTLNMDVYNALTTNKANVDIETATNETSQRFALYPTNPVDDEMPVPANLGWCEEVGDEDWDRVRPEATTYYPTWETTETWASDSFNHYEARYRTQSMSGSNSQWGDWSDWTAWETAAVTIDGQRVWITEGLSAEVPSGAKAYQYELQVRSAGINGDEELVHGVEVDATLRVLATPTVTLSNAGFGPDGLCMDYESDYDGGTTNIKFTSILDSDGNQLLTKAARQVNLDSATTGLDPSGSVLIAMSKLMDWIDDDESITVKYYVGTDQIPIIRTLCTTTLTVSYNTGSGLTVTPTVSTGEGRTLTLTCSGATASRVWVRMGDELVEMEVSDGTATLVYPFYTAYEVFAAGYSDDGDEWGVAHLEFDADSSSDALPCHAWNWDGGYFLLEIREGKALETDYSIGNDVDTFKLNKRGWDTARVSGIKTKKVRASGCFGDSLPTESTLDDLEALIDQCHATYRSPHGQMFDVAVTDVDLTCERDIWYADISMIRESI